MTARPFEVEPELRRPLGRCSQMFHFVSNLEIDIHFLCNHKGRGIIPDNRGVSEQNPTWVVT